MTTVRSFTVVLWRATPPSSCALACFFLVLATASHLFKHASVWRPLWPTIAQALAPLPLTIDLPGINKGMAQSGKRQALTPETLQAAVLEFYYRLPRATMLLVIAVDIFC